MLGFEDIKVGMTHELPPFELTGNMGAAHVKLYGEDWPDEYLPEVMRQGLMPSPLIISKVGGLMGKSGWLAIKVLKRYTVDFHQSFRIGDTVRTTSRVTKIRPHKDPSKDHGYVWVVQKICNQQGELAYERHLQYLVYIRSCD